MTSRFTMKPGDITWDEPEREPVAGVPESDRARAVFAELDSLARHVKKGRAMSTWEPRHIPAPMLPRIAELVAKGFPVDVAVTVMKALIRRVELDGQEVWIDPVPTAQAAVAAVAGGGARVPVPHDGDGTEVQTPGGTQSTEPPRWTPPNGTGTGPTFSDPRPRPVSKGETDPGDPNPVPWQHVFNQLSEDYPPDAIGWVKTARWIGPVNVAPARVDTDDEDSWAASHQPKRVKRFTKKLTHGKQVKPGVCVQEPGQYKVKIIDGHHRFLAAKAANVPYSAYVGFVDKDGGPWDETHAFQNHRLHDSDD